VADACLSPLAGGDGGCRSHLPGHRMPRMLAEVVRRSPWGWRRGTVVSVSPDGWMLLECRDGALRAVVHAWHHADLADQLVPGTEVRLHQRGGRLEDSPLGLGPAALDGPTGMISLHVAQGPPPVPEPVGLEAWAGDDDAVVIDLRTKAPLSLG